MMRAFRSVSGRGTLPATAMMPRTSSSSGLASASRMATASSWPGSVSMMILRGGMEGSFAGSKRQGGRIVQTVGVSREGARHCRDGRVGAAQVWVAGSPAVSGRSGGFGRGGGRGLLAGEKACGVAEGEDIELQAGVQLFPAVLLGHAELHVAVVLGHDVAVEQHVPDREQEGEVLVEVVGVAAVVDLVVRGRGEDHRPAARPAQPDMAVAEIVAGDVEERRHEERHAQKRRQVSGHSRRCGRRGQGPAAVARADRQV